jgi:hypothetical protein
MIRDDLLSYLTSNSLGSFGLSVELPFSNSGIPLYQKNPKKVYVDNDQVTVEPALETMAKTYYTTTTVVTVYFTCDAKQTASDYAAAVSLISNFIKDAQFNSYTSVGSDAQTEYLNDLMVTKIELSFTKFNT